MGFLVACLAVLDLVLGVAFLGFIIYTAVTR